MCHGLPDRENTAKMAVPRRPVPAIRRPVESEKKLALSEIEGPRDLQKGEI